MTKQPDLFEHPDAKVFEQASSGPVRTHGVKSSLEVFELTPDEAALIMALDEAQTYELKGREVAPAKLMRTLSAFANADGGELYVGIAENRDGAREWDGFRRQEDANGHIQAFEQAFPLGTYFDYAFLSCSNKPGLVLRAIINKTDRVTVCSNGTAYLRRGAQSIAQNTPELMRRLEYAKGVATYETELLNIDLTTITGSEVTSRFMSQVVPQSAPEDWLRKQALVRDGRPTVAGLLLFGDLPQAHLPKHCGVKIYRYKTKEAEGFRDALAFHPITVEGPLIEQIREAVARTVEEVEKIPRMTDGGLEAITYPQETIHEIVTNALIHRDYSIADDVHIRIFDNRIEVQSPGRLAAHVTLANVLRERAHRNGAIVRMLNKFPDPPNKDVGEGLNTAFRRMYEVGLKAPVLEQSENSFLVTIKHEPLAAPEETILEFVDAHGTIKNSQARQVTHITADYVMKRIFARMIKNGLIEQVPGTEKFTTCYRRPQNPANEP
jgi:ATP-dependent DNA helicase RecG